MLCGGWILHTNPLHVDLDRGRRYASWAQVFAVWTPDTLRGEEAWTACLHALQYAGEQESLHPDSLALVRDVEGLDNALERGPAPRYWDWKAAHR